MGQRITKHLLFLTFVLLLFFSSNCWMKKMVIRHFVSPHATTTAATKLPTQNQQKSSKNVNLVKTCQTCLDQASYVFQAQDPFKLPVLLLAAAFLFTFLLKNLLRGEHARIFRLARSPLPDKLPAYLRYRHLLLYH